MKTTSVSVHLQIYSIRLRTANNPVRAGARRVVLGSAGHLECLQMSWRRRKNNRLGLKELGFGDKSKYNKHEEKQCIDVFLIDWMSESAVILYIYRVGWTYPAKNPIYRSKSIKISSCIRTLLGPVRLLQQSDRSDRSVRPVLTLTNDHFQAST